MEAFIKDRRTFTTESHDLVLDYEIKRSIYDTVSSVTIKTPSILPKEGDIVYLETGFIGTISTVSVDHGRTELGINQIGALFSRNMFYTDASFTYLEDRIAELITDNFIQCSDTFYAMPYLNVRAVTHTASQMRPDLENNIYAVKSYAAKARRVHNIFLEWDISRTKLSVDVVRRVKTVKNVDFSNPDYILTAQDFSVKTVSKITTYCEENGQYKQWVLLKDGSIVNTEPATNRVAGEWATLVVPKAEDISEAVKDEFVKNEYSHKIEFQVSKEKGFELYDRLLIGLDNKVFSSYVSGVTERKGSNMVDVQCGELQMEFPYLDLA